MNHPVDQRGRLEDEVFSYRVTQNKRVFISWHGRTVTILKEKNAEKFLDGIAGLEGKEAQLLMAKATGNFKHGNERPLRK